MISFKNFLTNYYYKLRIALTFSFVTILLVLVMSAVSFYFIKELYLAQLSEQVTTSVSTAALQIDPGYIDILELGLPTGSASEYFNSIFSKHLSVHPNAELFIFNRQFDLLVHSNQNKPAGQTEANLLLNRHEIFNLKEGKAISTMPFKGDDGSWYLWGFYRLSGNSWLAMRESAARLANVEEFSRIFWYIGLAGVIITLGLSLLISGSITKPLNKLVLFSREIGKGNMNVEAPSGVKGEILTLSNAMSMMRNDLIRKQKEKEDILAQIAHEIRNPLGGIELLASLTREDLLREEKSTEYLDKILTEINGLKNLITAYLSYSRPVQAMSSKVRLAEIAGDAAGILSSRIKSRGVCLEMDLGAGEVTFDQGHLKQILLNLLSNSLESAGRNGKILLRSENTDGKIKISVIDDGPGITEANREKVFEPFFTTKKDGTGLGLAICRKLCNENRAEIMIEAIEKGCCISIIKENV